MSPSKPDLAWVEPGFALGSKPYSCQRRVVFQLGIRVVVSLHEPEASEAAAWREHGVRFYEVPTRDWVQIPVTNFDRVVEVVSAHLASATPVLLHCLAGINRAPTLAAAVLCKVRGMSVDDALALVKYARVSAKPTPEQEDSLRFWYRLRCR